MKLLTANGKLLLVGGKAIQMPDTAGAETAILDRSISGEYTNESLTAVQAYALAYCTHLTGVNFPNVTVLGNSALDNCTSLTSVNAPKVTKVGTYCMRGIKAAKLSFPALTSILSYAFLSCTNLTTLVLGAPTVCSLYAATAFSGSGINSDAGYVYVPSALVESYQTDSIWGTMASKIRAIEDYPDITGG